MSRRRNPARGWIGLLVLAASCGGGEQPRLLRTLSSAELPAELARLSAEKPVVLNLWATWCPPCMKELPDFAAAARERSDLLFLGLSGDWSVYSTDRTLDEDLSRVTERWRALEMPFASWYLADDDLDRLVDALDLPDGVFPQTMIYRGGERIAHHSSDLSAAELAEFLDAALGG